MDAKIQRWKSLPATLSEFVCAVPLSAIECKALAGILPEQCPRLEQIQVPARSADFHGQYVTFVALFPAFHGHVQLSLETDAAGAQHLLDMLPCFILLSSLHIDISNTTDAATLQHVARTLTVIRPPVTTKSKLQQNASRCARLIFTLACFFLRSTRIFKSSRGWSLADAMTNR